MHPVCKFLAFSAASLASSHALAADAVIVDPEPVDYVRVCDAYGSGFFYIPGTETCMRFSGYLRSSYEKLEIDVDDGSFFNGQVTNFGAGFPFFGPVGTAFGQPGEFNYTSWASRARLNIDTRNETDWGTLRTLFRLEGGSSNIDADVDMDAALISIAGFRAGFAGANYWSSNHGFGWVNSEGAGSTAGGIASDDGLYGFDDAVILDYTWARDGLAITVGVEDPNNSVGRENFTNVTNNSGTDDRVNFYAGVNYSAHWGGLAFTAVYDALAPEITLVTPGVFAGTQINDTGGWAYKASGFLNLSDFISGGSLWAAYMADGDYNTDYVHANNLLENAESAWGVAFQMNLSDEVEFWVNYWDVEGGVGHIFGGPGNTFGNLIFATNIQEGGVRQFGVGLNWYPASAPGFHIKASYVHGDVDNSAHALVCNGGFAFGPVGCSFEYDAFSVSLRRDF